MSGPTIKTKEEVEILRQGGRILAQVLREVAKLAKPGATTGALEELAEKLIREARGEPAFKGFNEKGSPPFPTTLCTSINDEVVHAPAVPKRALKDGDLLKIDIGMRWPRRPPLNLPLIKGEKEGVGLYTDMAMTVGVGKISKEARKLIEVTKKSLEIGIQQVRPGARVSDIGKAIQKFVEKRGFNVVRNLTGHGVGYKVHEPPEVPNFWQAGMKDCVLQEGMVICLEPMVNMGEWQIKTAADGWTVLTADGSLSAHFEQTVVVTVKGGEILTH